MKGRRVPRSTTAAAPYLRATMEGARHYGPLDGSIGALRFRFCFFLRSGLAFDGKRNGRR